MVFAARHAEYKNPSPYFSSSFLIHDFIWKCKDRKPYCPKLGVYVSHLFFALSLKKKKDITMWIITLLSEPHWEMTGRMEKKLQGMTDRALPSSCSMFIKHFRHKWLCLIWRRLLSTSPTQRKGREMWRKWSLLGVYIWGHCLLVCALKFAKFPYPGKPEVLLQRQ